MKNRRNITKIHSTRRKNIAIIIAMNIEDINSDFKVRVHKDKSGTLYVYEDMPYWDRIKKQGRHRRHYIGTLSDNNEFIPNREFLE